MIIKNPFSLFFYYYSFYGINFALIKWCVIIYIKYYYMSEKRGEEKTDRTGTVH